MTTPRAKAKPRRRPGAPRGNRNAVKSGIYVTGPDSDFEEQLAEAIAATFVAFEVSPQRGRPSGAKVERFVMDFLRLRRAIEQGDWTAAEKLDRTVRAHLRKLGAPEPPPKSRPRGPKEWAADLLRFVEKREKEKAGR